MKQNNKNQNKSKKYHKPYRKMSWIDKVKLWLLQHSKIAFLLDSSIFFLSAFGVFYLLFGTTVIPKPYQNFNYLFPLFLNLIFLVNMLYQGVFYRYFWWNAYSTRFCRTILVPKWSRSVVSLVFWNIESKQKEYSFLANLRSSLYLVPNSYLYNLLSSGCFDHFNFQIC